MWYFVILSSSPPPLLPPSVFFGSIRHRCHVSSLDECSAQGCWFPDQNFAFSLFSRINLYQKFNILNMISGSGFGLDLPLQGRFVKTPICIPSMLRVFIHVSVFVMVAFWCPHTQGLIPEKSLGLREKKFRMTCLFDSSHATLQWPPCWMTPLSSSILGGKISWEWLFERDTKGAWKRNTSCIYDGEFIGERKKRCWKKRISGQGWQKQGWTKKMEESKSQRKPTSWVKSVRREGVLFGEEEEEGEEGEENCEEGRRESRKKEKL